MSVLGGTYSTGTVALTNDDAVVPGTGVLWSDVEEGDWLYAGGVVGIIDSVNDDLDQITLKEPWAGSTDAAASYLILKMSWLRYEPALTQAKLRELLAQLQATGSFVFVESAPPDDELGEDGQFALKTNATPWRAWLKVDGAWVEQDAPGGGGGGSGKTIVDADLAIYVATTGNDITGDGTVGNPFRTIQHAADYVSQNLFVQSLLVDLSAKPAVIIQLADGTYEESPFLGMWEGTTRNGLGVIIQGNLGDKTAVVLKPPGIGGFGIVVDGPSVWSFQKLTIDVTDLPGGSWVLLVENFASTYTYDIKFIGSPASDLFALIVAGWGATVECYQGVELDIDLTPGQLTSVFYAPANSYLGVLGSGQLVLTSDPACYYGLLFAEYNSRCYWDIDYTGAHTGPCFTLRYGGDLTAWPNPAAIPGILADSYVDEFSRVNNIRGAATKSGLPATTDIPPGGIGFFKDSSGGGVKITHNDAGSLKHVDLLADPGGNRLRGWNDTTKADVYFLPAVYQATPSDPGGTTSDGTQVMAGLAGSITPNHTGRIEVQVSAEAANDTASRGVTMQIRYGTGSAPSNGAAATGTAAGHAARMDQNNAANKSMLTCHAIITGLAPGTAYWLDVGFCGQGAGTTTLTGVGITAKEV
jgi:hypothetical protein